MSPKPTVLARTKHPLKQQPQPPADSFAARLTAVRAMRRLSLREAAGDAVSYQTIKQLEHAGAEPVLSTVIALARALGCTPEWLAFGVGPAPVETDEDRAKVVPRAGRPRLTPTQPAPAESPSDAL